MPNKFPATGFLLVTTLGATFTATPGRWIGAMIGLFALGTVPAWELGNADADWKRLTAN